MEEAQPLGGAGPALGMGDRVTGQVPVRFRFRPPHRPKAAPCDESTRGSIVPGTSLRVSRLNGHRGAPEGRVHKREGMLRIGCAIDCAVTPEASWRS